ncbi:hypothetical protein Tco_1434264, partial [Tanacetum coccineum]
SMLSVPVSVISEPTVLTPVIQESPSIATVTTLPPPSISTTPSAPQQTTTPIPTPTITIDAPIIMTVVSESDALSAVQLRVAKLEKMEQAEKQRTSKFTIKSTDQASLKEYDQKSALYQTMHANKSFNQNFANHRLYHALMRRTKESESSKNPSTTKETPKGKALSKGSKTGKSASKKEPVEEPSAEVVMDDTGDDVVHSDKQPQDPSKPKTAKTPNPEWFTQPPRPPTPDPEWNKHQNNLKGDRYPFDLSKPLPLQGHPGHLIIAADYFFNNDLEYLKSSDLERTYTTSIMKTKATRYEIKGIEYMVPTLWSPTKVGSQLKKFSKHNVYSTKKILGVKSVSVKKLHGYGHLEEIVVKRADRQLYKFKEGDFVDLHMNDIEDMLLLVVQHKLFHLTDNDIVDFIVALRKFTRSLIIKKRVEDLQLGVESY